MKRLAILQSNYLPWKGYFDLINSVDIFIIYDVVQYTKNDWRNRNLIKTKNGVKWITIPIERKGYLNKKINEVYVSNKEWTTRHLNQIQGAYNKATYFKEVFGWLNDIYIGVADETSLSIINHKFIIEICKVLNIDTKIVKLENFVDHNEKNLNLINLCQEFDGDIYISGPAAKSYMDLELFKKNGIEVEWMNYNGYPEYKQLYGDFEHGVSIIDLLFNVGLDNAKYYITKQGDK